MSFTVYRELPEHLLTKIAANEAFISGGTIRVASGHSNAGAILAHLRFPQQQEQAGQAIERVTGQLAQQSQALGKLQQSSEAVSQSLSQLQSLSQFTAVMQGANLALTAVGFVIIAKKLNGISEQLKQMDHKLDVLYGELVTVKSELRAKFYAEFTGALANIQAGLRTDDQVRISTALNQLTESRNLFRQLAAEMAHSPRAALSDIDTFSLLYQGAVGCDIALSNSQHQLGNDDEAMLLLTDAKAWQQQIQCSLLDELNAKPVWLGQLNKANRPQIRACLDTIKATGNNLQYLSDTLAIPELHNEGADDFLLVEVSR